MPKLIKKGSGSDRGPGVAETWVRLFEQNERAAKGKKMTDEDITAELNRTFPKKKSKIFKAVASVRSKYNAGGFNGGKRPAVQSFRYDTNGEQLAPRQRVDKDGAALHPRSAETRGSKSSKKKSTRKAA